MTVHVLREEGTETAVNRVSAAVGFAQMGEAVRWFGHEGFDALILDAEDVVVGGIGFAHAAFRRLGIPIPALAAMPEPLRPFAGRRIWPDAMGAVRRRVERGQPVFCKPDPRRHKLFPGMLLATVRDLIATASVADDEPVICAEPVRFLSEYRCFVLRGDAVGLRHYKGDFFAAPDASVARAAVAAWTDAPAGYALDVGVTDEGRTLVVEVNDGYACAPYGLTPLRYANVIAARWTELRATRAQTKGASPRGPAP